jgi:hypothetical protein
LLARLIGCAARSRREREFPEELDAHLHEHVADNLTQGMTHEEARRDALIKLGGRAAVTDRYRDRVGVPGLDALAQDLAFGVRMLQKNPSFTVLAVVTLALGIGINTTVFGALYAVLLRPLPFRNADRLVMVWQEYVTRDWGLVNVSYPNFIDLKDQGGVSTTWQPSRTESSRSRATTCRNGSRGCGSRRVCFRVSASSRFWGATSFRRRRGRGPSVP